jgi:hypothetical protein
MNDEGFLQCNSTIIESVLIVQYVCIGHVCRATNLRGSMSLTHHLVSIKYLELIYSLAWCVVITDSLACTSPRTAIYRAGGCPSHTTAFAHTLDT